VLAEKPSAIDPSDFKPGSTKKKIDAAKDIFGNRFTEDPVEEAFSNEKLDKTLKTVTLVPR